MSQHILPSLPYSLGALEPWMTRETLKLHHGKHHKGYVDKLNSLIHQTPYDEMSLEEIILQAPENEPIFNNAAQTWNHTFFWNSMIPIAQRGAPEPFGDLSVAIQGAFDTLEGFKKEFAQAATDLFGSGWVWLVQDMDTETLHIISTHNAQNPLRSGIKPLLTLDVWEHAYYVDYRNERQKFVAGFWDFVNWRFAEGNLRGEVRRAA